MIQRGAQGGIFFNGRQVGAFADWQLKTTSKPLFDGGGAKDETYTGWSLSSRRHKFNEPMPDGELEFRCIKTLSFLKAVGKVVSTPAPPNTVGEKLEMAGAKKPIPVKLEE